MNLDKFKALAAKYALVVGVIVGSFLIVGGVAVFVYSAMQRSGAAEQQEQQTLTNPDELSSDDTLPDEDVLFDAFTPPDRTTALVLGIHPLGGISDVMLLVTFDATTDKIDIITLPRDTFITLPPEDVNTLHTLGRTMTPSNGVMKLNELHSYAGKDYGPECSKKFIENMLNVTIDYTVVMDTAGFRNIIDTAGGIDMTLRKEGYHYSDPEQKLYINVPGGFQHLDGKSAEGVVRFRDDYAGGDLDRIPVQQEFMKCFFEQILSKESIKSNWLGFLSSLMSYVKTDFSIDDLPKYISSIDKLKPENIKFHSLPGGSEYIGDVSYYIYSPEQSKKLIDEVFTAPVKKAAEDKSASKSNIIIDKTLTIQILNGTDVNRLGTRKSDELKKAGYTIKDVGTYQGVKQPETRIVVKNKDLAEQFKSYFKNAVVEVDLDIPVPYNVIIILGTSEGE